MDPTAQNPVVPSVQAPMAPSSQAAITSTGSGPNKVLKAVLIVGAVVLVVVVAEFAYRLLHPGDKIIPRDTVEEVSESALPAVEPTEELSDVKSIRLEKLGILTQALEALDLKKGFVEAATSDLTIKGVVVVAEQESVVTDYNDLAFKLLIRNGSGQTLNLHFTQEEVRTASVTLVSPNGPTLLRMDDVRAGDTVIIRQTIDHLDTSPNVRLILEVQRL